MTSYKVIERRGDQNLVEYEIKYNHDNLPEWYDSTPNIHDICPFCRQATMVSQEIYDGKKFGSFEAMRWYTISDEVVKYTSDYEDHLVCMKCGSSARFTRAERGTKFQGTNWHDVKDD